MSKQEKIKSYYDLEIEDEFKKNKKSSKNIESENTFLDRFSDNIWVFFLMIIFSILTLWIYGGFFNIMIIGFIPVPIINKHFLPFDLLGDNKMYWTAGIIGLSILGIYWKLFKSRFIKNTLNNSKTYKYIILTSILGYVLFMLLNPWYTLQMYPRLFMYQDGKNITNKEIYFYLTEKYGFKSTLYKPFKTIEDSIDGLEFAKKINSKLLYKYIYYDMEKFGYDKLFDKYKDKTFQVYFLRNLITTDYLNDDNFKNVKFFKNNILFLKNLTLMSNDELIVSISREIINEYKSINNTDSSNEQIINFIKYIEKKYIEKTWGIKNIDKDIFEY